MIRGGGLALILTCACAHWDLGERAPAHANVIQPPTNIAKRIVEEGSDPGERWFVIRPGPFVGAQMSIKGDRSRFAQHLGFELSLTGATRSMTHRHPFHGFGKYDLVDLAANLGADHAPRSIEGPAATALYFELQASIFGIGAAGGWRWSPEHGDHGPQVTGFFGPLFLRASYHLDGPFALAAGLFIKGELAWAWSR